MQSEKSKLRTEEIYVNGTWQKPEKNIEVTDLSTGETFATIGAAKEEHIEYALTSAKSVENELRRTSIPKRVSWLEEIANGLESRKEELAEIIVREAGKPISSARGEVEAAVERFRRAKEEIRALKGEYRAGTTGGHENWDAIVKHEPVGTVAVIAPYNYPVATTTLSLAPAIAAGNSIVFKPSTKTPISGAILTEVIVESGFPDEAFNFVPGYSRDIGDKLSGDERVNLISMTGSSNAGQRVAKQSGMTKLHMELGGNAPAIVLPDSDIENAVEQCAKGSFKYGGQRCSAVSRILVHEDCYDEFVSRFEDEMDNWNVGDLFDESTKVGPLISEEHAKWVESLLSNAIENGSNCVTGGNREGATFEPTLLTDVPHDSELLETEQFGPIAVVTEVRNSGEAVEIANSGDLSLDASVFTNKHDMAMNLADEIDAGAVRINGAPSHGLGDIPFGGNKSSGIGRQGLHTTIEDMVRTKSIVL